jgi:biotin carboxyl carrier protein
LAQEKVEFPITGKVTGISVKKGDAVQEGDTLCLIESMKMENPILSTVNGKVTDINLTIGQVVEAGNTVALIDY